MAYLMISVTLAEWTRPSPVPVTVSVEVPFLTLRAVDSVSTEVPEPVIDDGWKDAVTRDGRPPRLRLTAPDKPDPAATVTVQVVEEPREIVRLDGVTVSVKSAPTTIVTFTVRVTGPLVPRIVNV